LKRGGQQSVFGGNLLGRGKGEIIEAVPVE